MCASHANYSIEAPVIIVPNTRLVVELLKMKATKLEKKKKDLRFSGVRGC